ncbi:MAG: 16S rRNA (cytosine(967)-C(5))-methyltransferase RsmB, partial [Erysipelotrichaceae bacterium]
MMNARSLSHAILCDVMMQGQYANLALKQRLKQVETVDKAFVTKLVYSTLTYQLICRARWSSYVAHKPKERMAILLDMSLAQLFYFDRIPEYAIVNEAVEIAKHESSEYGRMINAVLRKVIANQINIVKDIDINDLALTYALPKWIFALWEKQYGLAEAILIAESLLQEENQTIRLNLLNPLTIKDPFLNPLDYPNAYDYEGNLLESEIFKQGQVFPQDLSSQIVVDFCDVKPKQRVLDMCSAPGSKAVALAGLMRNQGVIIACDIHPQRVQLINEIAEKCQVSIIKTDCLDTRFIHLSYPVSSFDVVLVDAPCSGLGVLRHKPDIKIHLKPETIDQLIILQYELLNEASLMVSEDGVLVYSTCTINRKENQSQIIRFLKEHLDFICVEEKQ